jgi:hypothetical protein
VQSGGEAATAANPYPKEVFLANLQLASVYNLRNSLIRFTDTVGPQLAANASAESEENNRHDLFANACEKRAIQARDALRLETSST